MMMKRKVSLPILALCLGCMALLACCATTEPPGETTNTAQVQQHTDELGPLTKDILTSYNSGNYHVKYEGEMAGGGRATTEVFAKDGNLALMCPEDDFNREIIKNGFFYRVNDSQKQVAVMSLDEANPSPPVPPDISALRYVGSGTAEFMGEKLDCDEYSHTAGYQAIYFVKDGTLKGIRHVSDGFAIDVKYLIFEAQAPDSAFDIPTDYEIIG